MHMIPFFKNFLRMKTIGVFPGAHSVSFIQSMQHIVSTRLLEISYLVKLTLPKYKFKSST